MAEEKVEKKATRKKKTEEKNDVEEVKNVSKKRTTKKETKVKKPEEVKLDISDSNDLVVVSEDKPKRKRTTTKKVEAENMLEEKKESKQRKKKVQEEKEIEPSEAIEKVEEVKKEELLEKDSVLEEKVDSEVVKEGVNEPVTDVPVVNEDVVLPALDISNSEDSLNKPLESVSSDTTIVLDRSTIRSEFDGKVLQLIGWYLLGFLVSVVTLGIGEAFAKCFILNWQYKHTKINGRRLCFDGNGFQLLGNYIKWTFFTIITLGIYSLFIPVQWNKWVIKHTHYEGNKKPVVNYSLFDGTTWEYIGISILSFFLKLFSFGLLKPFCDNLMYSWRINHTTYDTIDMEFDGKGFQLLGNYIKWTFFTIITLGIYGLWVPIRRLEWEVKHTNEKGFSKHPYKPVLGMILPVLFAIACVNAEVFGLLQVDKSTWTDIRDDIRHYVHSIIKETKRYDFGHVIAERGADFIYRIETKDINISFEERYRRFFHPSWYDKAADNKFSRVFTGEVDMAMVDINGYDTPILIAKYDNMYRVFWLYEKRIENHFYFTIDENCGFYLANDGEKEYLAYIEKNASNTYYLYNVYDTVNYEDKYVVFAFDYESFIKEIKNQGITLNPIDIHYSVVDVDDMDGFDEMVDYYYEHTDRVYEVNETSTVRDFKDDYLNYLKEQYQGSYRVAVLDDIPSMKTVLVVFSNNRTDVLFYEDEVKAKGILANATLSVLNKISSNKNEYVLITNSGNNKVYGFVSDFIKDDISRTMRFKSDSVSKSLKEKGYKEVSNSIDIIEIKNSDDYDKLEKRLHGEKEDVDPYKEYELTSSNLVSKAGTSLNWFLAAYQGPVNGWARVVQYKAVDASKVKYFKEANISKDNWNKYKFMEVTGYTAKKDLLNDLKKYISTEVYDQLNDRDNKIASDFYEGNGKLYWIYKSSTCESKFDLKNANVVSSQEGKTIVELSGDGCSSQNITLTITIQYDLDTNKYVVIKYEERNSND